MLDVTHLSKKVEHDKMRVLKDSHVVLKAFKIKEIYVLEGETMIGSVAIANENNDKCLMWHRRLGYLND